MLAHCGHTLPGELDVERTDGFPFIVRKEILKFLEILARSWIEQPALEERIIKFGVMFHKDSNQRQVSLPFDLGSCLVVGDNISSRRNSDGLFGARLDRGNAGFCFGFDSLDLDGAFCSVLDAVFQAISDGRLIRS